MVEEDAIMSSQMKVPHEPDPAETAPAVSPEKVGSGFEREGAAGLGAGLWLLASLLVVGICLGVFGRTLGFGFTNWDDDVNVVSNPYLHPATWANASQLWRVPYRSLYVPLVYSSYLLEFWIAGGKPWIFHLTNILLHAASALVVMRILWLIGRPRDKFGMLAALFGALVFAAHPVQVEAVAWVTGRKDLLSGLFSLLALWLYLGWRLAGTSEKGRGKSAAAVLRYLGASACFLLALLAKPSAVSLPLAALALDWYVLGRKVKESLAWLSPWFGVSLLWVLLTRRAQPVPQDLLTMVPLWTRPFVAGDALLFYLRKLLLWGGFAPVYGRFPWQVLQSGWGYAALPLAGGLLGAALCRRTRAGAAAALFLVPLLPVLGLVPFRYQIFSTTADRYVYLSMLGVALGVCLAAAWLFERSSGWRRATVAACVLCLAWLAGASFNQTRIWSSSVELWKHTLGFAPGLAEVHNNLGMALLDAGQGAKATEQFVQAVKLKPYHADANNNLGNQLLDLGRTGQAIECFKRSIAARPDYAIAHNNLGNAFFQSGQVEKAIAEYAQAVRLAPGMVQARKNLALAQRRALQLAVKPPE